MMHLVNHANHHISTFNQLAQLEQRSRHESAVTNLLPIPSSILSVPARNLWIPGCKVFNQAASSTSVHVAHINHCQFHEVKESHSCTQKLLLTFNAPQLRVHTHVNITIVPQVTPQPTKCATKVSVFD